MTGGGAANLNAFLKDISEREKRAIEQNRKLKLINERQDKIIEKQRSLLKEVAKANVELIEVEKKRDEIKKKLASLKTQLLVTSSEAQELSSATSQILEQTPERTPISDIEQHKITLLTVDFISEKIVELSRSCANSKNHSVPTAQLQEKLIAVNKLFQKIIDEGYATESSQETIERQGYVISALVSTAADGE